jgi:hypothetical protein
MPGKPIWSHESSPGVSYGYLSNAVGMPAGAAAITAIRLTGEEAVVMDVTGIANTHKQFICGAINAGTLELDVIVHTRTTAGAAIALPTAGDNSPTTIQFFLGTPTGDPAEHYPDITLQGYIQNVSMSAAVDDVVRATVTFRCTGSTIHTSTI